MDELNRAIGLIRQGKHDEGLQRLSALTNDPRFRADALGHRAWLLMSMGRFDEARRDYEDLVTINPADDDAQALFAESCFRAGHSGEALRRAIEVLQKNPHNRRAAELVLQVQESQGILPTKAQQGYQADGPHPPRPLNPALELLEQAPGSYPASVFPEVGRFLYVIVRFLRPNMVLETGCYVGYSTICIAQALEENGAGHVHSFDLFPPMSHYTSPVIGPTDDQLHAALAHVGAAGLSHRVTFHKGDSAALIQETLQPTGARFGFAFIDGDHTVRGCLRDWRAVDQLIAPGGLVALHDTFPENCGWLGPRTLIKMLEQAGASKYQAVNLPSPEGFGVALVQKRIESEAGDRWQPRIFDLLRDLLWETLNGRNPQTVTAWREKMLARKKR